MLFVFSISRIRLNQFVHQSDHILRKKCSGFNPRALLLEHLHDRPPSVRRQKCGENSLDASRISSDWGQLSQHELIYLFHVGE